MLFKVAIVVAFVIVAQPSAQAPPTDPAPPGRLVDIGGRKLHLHCSGTGGPTVILIAGGSAFSLDWALVQPRVAQATRVCSYDRAGLAWSDPGPGEETVEQTAADLQRVLRAAGETDRLVLVGASIAGLFVRAYQRAHSAEVAGLVFTNSSNRVGMIIKDNKGGLIWDLTEDEIRSTFPLPQTAKGPAPVRVGEPFDRLPPELQAVRLQFAMRLWERSDPTKATPDSMLSWRREFLRLFEETDAGKKPPLEIPVVVLSSGPAGTDADRQSRSAAAPRLDFLSANTSHITASGSGHEIHLYQPDMVVRAVLDAVSAVRNRAAPSGR